MTVLQRDTRGTVGSQSSGRFLVALLLAVVGLGAAFGLSRVIGSDSSQLFDNQARIEAGAAYGAALEKAAETQARIEAGEAYGAALESANQSNVWTLEDELSAIRKGKVSVGSAAIAEHSNSLGWELEQINGGGTTSSDVETATQRTRHNFK